MDLTELCANAVCINLCFVNAEQLMGKQSVPAELYLLEEKLQGMGLDLIKSQRWYGKECAVTHLEHFSASSFSWAVVAQSQMVNSGINMHVNAVICNLCTTCRVHRQRIFTGKCRKGY